MTGYALELNDADVSAWDVTHEVLRESGYAYVGSDPWRFGAAAAAMARLHPRDTATAQFAQIDAARVGAIALPAADIVYRQFKSWEPVLGAAPGAWLVSPAASDSQLGLLLGVAQAAGLSIAALVDRAVAAVSALPFEGPVFCVDVELERAVVTEVQLRSGRAMRHRVVSLADLGQRVLYEAWSKGFAARMVQGMRFDPLHVAGSEQALFDALPAWLATLLHEERIEDAAIDAGGVRYAIEYRASQAVHDVAGAYRALAATLHGLRRAQERAAILLTATTSRLPGLIGALQDLNDCDVFTAKSGQAAQAALGLVDLPDACPTATMLALSLPHNPYHSWLPARPAVALSNDAFTPTHVVYGGRAVRLAEGPVVVGTAPTGARVVLLPSIVAGVSRVHCSLMRQAGQSFVADHSRFGSFLNDERIQARALLRVGDRLRLGNPGVELNFVRME